ncbi:MAG: family 1 glycosylhydrolase [Trueperaceae bacterium]|nr:family 1 glycosylhydrolase [Trueperaceae bacterium]
MKPTCSFPDGFLWGTATAAHQVEGNNVNSDFWVLEHIPGTIVAEPSGDACDHFHRYREDIKLLADLGFSTYRFSIEWARVEPEQGLFSAATIAHYRDMLQACEEHELMPMVTLHHFTSPRWLMRLGGWTAKETPELFARYVSYVMEQLGEQIPYVCTLNEVNLPDLLAHIMASRAQAENLAPVGIKEDNDLSWLQKAALAFGLDKDAVIHPFPYTYVERGNFVEVALEAHRQARAAIRRISPDTKVGFSLALHEIDILPGGEAKAEETWQTLFKQYLPTLKDDDFFALQNYTREVIGPDGPVFPEGAERTQMGYEYRPEALAGVVLQVAKDLKIPIIITENGVATPDDQRRVEFIERALKGLHACIQDGIDIQGYYYWSAFDNYEWVMGYRMTFGLIAVDRTTQKRTIKESAHYLGKIAQANGL